MLSKNLGMINHHRNIQVSMTELCKIMDNLADLIMDMFTPRVKNFNLRNFQKFATERKRTIKCSLETVS